VLEEEGRKDGAPGAEDGTEPSDDPPYSKGFDCFGGRLPVLGDEAREEACARRVPFSGRALAWGVVVDP
jgi:hypothetical protein